MRVGGRVMRVVKWEEEERGRGREPGHAGTQTPEM